MAAARLSTVMNAPGGKRWRPKAPPLTGSSLVVALGALGGALCCGLWSLRSRGRLGEHVDDDEVAHHGGGGVAKGARIAVLQNERGNLAEWLGFGVRRPDRIILIVFERLADIAERCDHPRIVLLLLPHEAEVFLRCVGILRVFEHEGVEDEVLLRGLADRADRVMGVVHVL